MRACLILNMYSFSCTNDWYYWDCWYLMMVPIDYYYYFIFFILFSFWKRWILYFDPNHAFYTLHIFFNWKRLKFIFVFNSNSTQDVLLLFKNRLRLYSFLIQISIQFQAFFLDTATFSYQYNLNSLIILPNNKNYFWTKVLLILWNIRFWFFSWKYI